MQKNGITCEMGSNELQPEEHQFYKYIKSSSRSNKTLVKILLQNYSQPRCTSKESSEKLACDTYENPVTAFRYI